MIIRRRTIRFIVATVYFLLLAYIPVAIFAQYVSPIFPQLFAGSSAGAIVWGIGFVMDAIIMFIVTIIGVVFHFEEGDPFLPFWNYGVVPWEEEYKAEIRQQKRGIKLKAKEEKIRWLEASPEERKQLQNPYLNKRKISHDI